MRSLRRLCRRLAAVATAAVLCFHAAPAIADAVEEPGVGVPNYPDIWGARLPAKIGIEVRGSSLIVTPEAEIVIEYSVGRLPTASRPFPQTIYFYSFFLGKLLHRVELTDFYAMRSDTPPEYQEFLDIRRRLYGKPFEQRWIPHRLTRYRLWPWEETPAQTEQPILGSLENPRLFPVGLLSPFDYNYVRRDPFGRVIADKVFFEVFAEPITIPPRSGWFVASYGQFKDIRAIALELDIYRLPDGTLLGMDYDRLIAVRLTDRLESPYFEQDRNLIAIDGATVRGWIEEGYAKLPNRSQPPAQDDVDDVTFYLEDKIVEAWRARR